MLKVPYGQDPYSVIGKYIRDHITTIEDIIAVIKIDEVETNQLFMVDMNEENYFIWDNDWYEGEKDVALIDFFPVSEAINPSFQINSIESNDTINRRAAIDEIRKCRFVVDAIEKIRGLPPAQSYTEDEIQKIQDFEQAQFDKVYELGKQAAQPEIIYCKDCRHWDKTWTNDWAKDYHYCPVVDGVRKASFYCADAERRTDEQTD